MGATQSSTLLEAAESSSDILDDGALAPQQALKFPGGPFTFEACVPPLGYIEDKGVASDELLLRLGFKLCDEDTLWYHPRAIFKCVDSMNCKWQRGTIRSCSATIADIGKQLDSLYHPFCVNKECIWKANPLRIMRLLGNDLITIKLSEIDPGGLWSRFKGKSLEESQDPLDSKPVIVTPTAEPKETNEEPAKRRKIDVQPLPRATTAVAIQEDIKQEAPASRCIVPPSAAISTRSEKRKARPEDGPSEPRSGTSDAKPDHDVANLSVVDNPDSPQETWTAFLKRRNDHLETKSSEDYTRHKKDIETINDLRQEKNALLKRVERLELEVRQAAALQRETEARRG